LAENKNYIYTYTLMFNMRTIPSEERLKNALTEELCVEWLLDVGVIERQKTCDECSATVNVNIRQETYRHVCSEGRREVSMWKNTLFSKSKLKPHQTMRLLYSWLNGETPQQ
jgi:hypothetical protein